MGRMLITIGFLLVGAGVLVQLGLPLGRLPGDIVIRRGSGTFYFPIVTCLVVSAILTLAAWIFRR
jgi:hypothetical protein